MFDSTNCLNIIYTEDVYANIDSFDKKPLNQIGFFNETLVFGCNLTGFIGFEKITDILLELKED